MAVVKRDSLLLAVDVSRRRLVEPLGWCGSRGDKSILTFGVGGLGERAIIERLQPVGRRLRMCTPTWGGKTVSPVSMSFKFEHRGGGAGGG